MGQGTLLHMYEKLFAEYGKIVAQVLLTKDDFQERLRYLNCRNTLLTLLSLGVIPIINENDTVVVDEIKFGDNDTLSALVAGSVNADLLIILSDIDGLYDDDPRRNPEAKRRSEVYEITEEMEKSSHSRGTKLASGGMYTKLLAARMVMTAGIPMVVADGADKDILRRIIAGEQVGTLFVPRENKMHARERWIAFSSFPQGSIQVDTGARDAIYKRGKSLLPGGVVGVDGDFERGEVVAIIDRMAMNLLAVSPILGGEIALLPAKKLLRSSRFWVAKTTMRLSIAITLPCVIEVKTARVLNLPGTCPRGCNNGTGMGTICLKLEPRKWNKERGVRL